MTEEEILSVIRELDSDAIRLILKGHADCACCPDVSAVCVMREHGELSFGCGTCCGHDDPSGLHWMLEEIEPAIREKFAV